MKIIWTKLSVEKLEAIADYISLDSNASAKKWVINIKESITKLSDFPELGRVVPEIGCKDI